MYKIVDYYTGKRTTDCSFPSKEAAEKFKHEHLKALAKSGEVHNNLLMIEEMASES